MFRFIRKPSSGSHSQYLAKITHLVQCRYIELVQDAVSVMAAYCDLYELYVSAMNQVYNFS
jgi:phage terminase small subunit